MRVKRMSLVLLCALMARQSLPAARQALAQDTKADPGLSDVLTDMLRGAEGENATSGPDKRVPFGREEMQLSFAPLVKQTAPAVVNVYASQTARLRLALRRRSVLRAVLRPLGSRARSLRSAPACWSIRQA